MASTSSSSSSSSLFASTFDTDNADSIFDASSDAGTIIGGGGVLGDDFLSTGLPAAADSGESAPVLPASTFLALRATLPPYFLEALTVMVMALTVFGTVGNVMTFIVVMTKELRELSLGVYMAFLAVFDTLTLVCGFVW